MSRLRPRSLLSSAPIPCGVPPYQLKVLLEEVRVLGWVGQGGSGLAVGLGQVRAPQLDQLRDGAVVS